MVYPPARHFRPHLRLLRSPHRSNRNPYASFRLQCPARLPPTEIHGPSGYSIWWCIAHRLLYGIAARSGFASALAFAALSLLLLWLILLFLYRHRDFLKV